MSRMAWEKPVSLANRRNRVGNSGKIRRRGSGIRVLGGEKVVLLVPRLAN